jgi:hypothetical protein
MIGKFKDAATAEKAKEIIDKITEFMSKSDDDHRGADRYSDGALALLSELNVNSLGPAELEQFIYGIRAEVENDKVFITTNEIEVSSFLKIMIDKGARVEVYSAHDYPDTEYGRSKKTS